MANLWIAASDNNLPVIQALFATKAHTPNDRDQHGYTPMHAAASYSHIELLRYLVSEGGDVNITDDDGETPLFVVETKEAAKVLIEELGADWKHKNSQGVTAREKFEEEIEEDGEPLEAVVEYLKGLEDGESTVAQGLEDELKDAISDRANVRVAIESVPEMEEPDNEQIAERRRKVEELLQSDNPEEGIRRLVEEAVRLQLSEEARSSSSPRAVRQRVESEEDKD
ncbi:ankyrin repeat-containing protein [Lipomyces kononenkoae]|uniref:Ankyrin repeat-containing protein n=1 Tax=Lipomyces kononenkoae TaxID=34357 RepID=A0ACC3SSW2_LIPKO